MISLTTHLKFVQRSEWRFLITIAAAAIVFVTAPYP